MSRTYIELHKSDRSRRFFPVERTHERGGDIDSLPTQIPLGRGGHRTVGTPTIYRKLDRWFTAHIGETFEVAYSKFLTEFVSKYPSAWRHELVRLFKTRLPAEEDYSVSFLTGPARAKDLKHWRFELRDGKICQRPQRTPQKAPTATTSFIPVPVELRENKAFPEAWRRLGSVWFRFRTIPSIVEPYLPRAQRDPTPYEMSGYNREFAHTAWSTADTCSKKEINRQIYPEAYRLGIQFDFN